MSDVNIYTFEADGIPESYVDLSDYAALEAELAKLRAGQEPVDTVPQWRYDVLIQHAKHQDKVIAKLNDEKNTAWLYEQKEVWFWQGDGEDYPESLCCPVVIKADDLRALIAATPQPSAVPDGLRAKLEEGLNEITSLCRHLRHGGCDSTDLHGLEEGLTHAIDMAAEMLSMLTAAAPSAPATVQGDALTGEYHADVNHLLSVSQQLLEALEAAEKKLCIAEYHLDKGEDDSVVFESEILLARAAIAAARKEGGKV